MLPVWNRSYFMEIWFWGFNLCYIYTFDVICSWIYLLYVNGLALLTLRSWFRIQVKLLPSHLCCSFVQKVITVSQWPQPEEYQSHTKEMWSTCIQLKWRRYRCHFTILNMGSWYLAYFVHILLFTRLNIPILGFTEWERNTIFKPSYTWYTRWPIEKPNKWGSWYWFSFNIIFRQWQQESITPRYRTCKATESNNSFDLFFSFSAYVNF